MEPTTTTRGPDPSYMCRIALRVRIPGRPPYDATSSSSGFMTAVEIADIQPSRPVAAQVDSTDRQSVWIDFNQSITWRDNSVCRPIQTDPLPSRPVRGPAAVRRAGCGRVGLPTRAPSRPPRRRRRVFAAAVGALPTPCPRRCAARRQRVLDICRSALAGPDGPLVAVISVWAASPALPPPCDRPALSRCRHHRPPPSFAR